MADTPEPSAGDIDVTINGETYTLRCTLSACLALTRAPGGIYGMGGVAERMARADLDTVAHIMRTGLGWGPRVNNPELERQIFSHGLLDARNQVSHYIGAVVNGGKPYNPEAEEAGQDGEENPQSSAGDHP